MSSLYSVTLKMQPETPTSIGPVSFWYLTLILHRNFLCEVRAEEKWRQTKYFTLTSTTLTFVKDNVTCLLFSPYPMYIILWTYDFEAFMSSPDIHAIGQIHIFALDDLDNAMTDPKSFQCWFQKIFPPYSLGLFPSLKAAPEIWRI